MPALPKDRSGRRRRAWWTGSIIAATVRVHRAGRTTSSSCPQRGARRAMLTNGDVGAERAQLGGSTTTGPRRRTIVFDGLREPDAIPLRDRYIYTLKVATGRDQAAVQRPRGMWTNLKSHPTDGRWRSPAGRTAPGRTRRTKCGSSRSTGAGYARADVVRSRSRRPAVGARRQRHLLRAGRDGNEQRVLTRACRGPSQGDEGVQMLSLASVSAI